MTGMDRGDHNPFVDPPLQRHRSEAIDATTFAINRDVSLTLGTDSLIVLGMMIRWKHWGAD